MAESNAFDSARKWIVEHKLRTVGTLWLTGIAGSFSYNWSQPNMKTSVKLIHARIHAQALTLGALAGAALVEYYDRKNGSNHESKNGSNHENKSEVDRYGKFAPIDNFSRKN